MGAKETGFENVTCRKSEGA